jgi:outer membrane receptor protein involved in Fe transport
VGRAGHAAGPLRHRRVAPPADRRRLLFAERHDSFGDYVYDYVGYSNIWHPLDTPHVGPDRVTGPVFERRSDQESALFAQDIVSITPQLTLHGGLRYVETKRRDWIDPRITSIARIPSCCRASPWCTA